jgi:hypothetical protein
LDVVKAVIEDGVLVPTADHAEALLRLVTPLIADREGVLCVVVLFFCCFL